MTLATMLLQSLTVAPQVVYCSSKCQHDYWPKHKVVCGDRLQEQMTRSQVNLITYGMRESCNMFKPVLENIDPSETNQNLAPLERMVNYISNGQPLPQDLRDLSADVCKVMLQMKNGQRSLEDIQTIPMPLLHYVK